MAASKAGLSLGGPAGLWGSGLVQQPPHPHLLQALTYTNMMTHTLSLRNTLGL